MKVRPIRICGELAFVPLTKGLVAVIDASDAPLVEGRNWHSQGRYAATTEYDADGKRKTILMHRVIADTPEGMVTDHISGDRLDNRRANLRHAEHAENMWNIGVSKRNTSGYKGVSWSRSEQKWEAKICIRGTRIHLGLFPSAESANAMYQYAAKELHGNFMRAA